MLKKIITAKHRGFCAGVDRAVEMVEKSFFKDVRDSSLISRFLTVSEVANTILYLSSPLSSGTNGASIRVDGGSMGSII